MKKTALIIGVTGQEGYYLAKFLLGKNYLVLGMDRDFMGENYRRIKTLSDNYKDKPNNLSLFVGDILDTVSLQKVIVEHKPDEIYNLAWYTDFEESFGVAQEVGDVYGVGSIKLLETVDKSCRKSKIFNMVPFEVFGELEDKEKLSEKSGVSPVGPLALAKSYAYLAGISYKKTHRLFVSNGIVSERYSEMLGEFSTVKSMTLGLSKVVLGIEKSFKLQVDLDWEHEWLYTPNLVEGMWLSLQQYAGDNYVFGAEQGYSYRDFVEMICEFLEIEPKWEKKSGDKEVLIDVTTQKTIMETVPTKYGKFRPNHVVSDSAKAKRILGWQHQMNFARLSKRLIENDYNQIKRII